MLASSTSRRLSHAYTVVPALVQVLKYLHLCRYRSTCTCAGTQVFALPLSMALGLCGRFGPVLISGLTLVLYHDKTHKGMAPAPKRKFHMPDCLQHLPPKASVHYLG